MKLLIIAAFCAVAHGASYGAIRESQSEEANYNFVWSVSDPESYVYTSQKESRNGDSTQGEYTLVEEDGSIRKVTYEVNGDSGFTAVVNGVKFPQEAPADPNAEGNGGSPSRQGAAKPKPKSKPRPAPAPAAPRPKAAAAQAGGGSSSGNRNGGGASAGSSSVSIQTPKHSVSY